MKQPRAPLPKSKRPAPSTKSSPPAGPGALREELASGQAYDVSAVIDARTGERFVAAVPPNDCWLVTSPRVADAHEKQRLAATYSAALVDMEAAAIARLAQMRGIPFYCIKGISDGYTDKLPDFNRFISTRRPVSDCFASSFLRFSGHGTGPHSSGWAKIVERLPAAIAHSLLDLLDERRSNQESGMATQTTTLNPGSKKQSPPPCGPWSIAASTTCASKPSLSPRSAPASCWSKSPPAASAAPT